MRRRTGCPLGLLLGLLGLQGVVADNLALLSGTLRTYQRAGCDDDQVTLWCPRGTSISVQLAQYGKSSPAQALCGSSRANSTCLWPSALQYSLLQTVVEACQKKRHCKFQASPKTFGGDPCPGSRKYVEVAYKCRPYEFRSKVACQGDTVQLECNPNSRIAVYSASFGRTEYESIQCPQPQGVPEQTCLVSYATEMVMRFCHGKRRCSLPADSATFGKPCRVESRMYLKVVYTCVPRKVLKEDMEEATQADELLAEADDADDLDGYDADDFFRESAAFSPSPNVHGGSREPPQASATTTPKPAPPHARTKGAEAKDLGKFGRYTTPYLPYKKLSKPYIHSEDLATTKDMQGDDVSDEKILPNSNCTVTIYTNEKTRVIGFISEWINAYNFISRNQEKFYLYLILSVTAGLLLFLGLVIGRLLMQRRRSQQAAKPPAPEHTLPNGFADDLSEVEAEMDLTAPISVHQPPTSVSEVVRFGGTLRRGDTDAPRSLNRADYAIVMSFLRQAWHANLLSEF